MSTRKKEECILYYWIGGVPEDRPGGPWWHKRFDCPIELSQFKTCLRGLLHASALAAIADHDCDEECHKRPPPDSAVIFYPKKWR